MKRLFFVLMAICLVMAIGSSFAFAYGPGPVFDSKAGHPGYNKHTALTDSHEIKAYVEPFAKITWGKMIPAYLEGDGTPGVGSIGVRVEANTTVNVDVKGYGFTSTEQLYTDNGHKTKLFYLKSDFSINDPSFRGIPSITMDDTHKDLMIFYKATPLHPVFGQGAIEATHAGWYEGNVYITVTNASKWDVKGPLHHYGGNF